MTDILQFFSIRPFQPLLLATETHRIMSRINSSFEDRYVIRCIFSAQLRCAFGLDHSISVLFIHYTTGRTSPWRLCTYGGRWPKSSLLRALDATPTASPSTKLVRLIHFLATFGAHLHCTFSKISLFSSMTFFFSICCSAMEML